LDYKNYDKCYWSPQQVHKTPLVDLHVAAPGLIEISTWQENAADLFLSTTLNTSAVK
jgi:hypothetical protein